MYKPPLFFVIFALVVFAYANYIFYQLWFEQRKFLDNVKKQYGKLPRWYPFRSFFISAAYNDKGLITIYKIGSVFGEIFLVIWFGLILIAWFTGK